MGASKDTTAVDGDEGEKGRDDGPGADDEVDGPPEDEYDATREANGADANGGFKGDDDPDVDSLPQEEDEPAKQMSSLALSMHSNFLF